MFSFTKKNTSSQPCWLPLANYTSAIFKECTTHLLLSWSSQNMCGLVFFTIAITSTPFMDWSMILLKRIVWIFFTVMTRFLKCISLTLSFKKALTLSFKKALSLPSCDLLKEYHLCWTFFIKKYGRSLKHSCGHSISGSWSYNDQTLILHNMKSVWSLEGTCKDGGYIYLLWRVYVESKDEKCFKVIQMRKT